MDTLSWIILLSFFTMLAAGIILTPKIPYPRKYYFKIAAFLGATIMIWIWPYSASGTAVKILFSVIFLFSAFKFYKDQKKYQEDQQMEEAEY